MSRAIAEALDRRGIRRLVYFHTDHFEPWRTLGGRAAIGPENLNDIERFADAMAMLPHGRRLSLFYKPHLNFGLREGADAIRVPGDRLAFFRRSEEQIARARAGIGRLVADGHDIQLHVHHENYTWNPSIADPEVRAWLSTSEGRGRDEARFELAVRLLLDILRQETGKPFDRWFFIHGHWALNASDPNECNLTREIEILLRNGCLGDFTFPAGRAHVDPRHQLPFLVDPVDAPKGYDLPEARPTTAYGAGPGADGRFFIWSSKAKHASVSLDHYSAAVRQRLEDPVTAGLDLVETAYAEAGTLFIKTHAHSLHPTYFEPGAAPVFPLAFDGARRMLGHIFEAASAGRVVVEFRHVGEVYDAIIGAAAPARPVELQASTPGRPVAPARPADGGAHAMTTWLNDAGAAFLRWRIDSMGEEASGLSGSYARRIRNGVFLPHYEREVLYYLLTEWPGRAAYVEIGSGIGSLPLLLAAHGKPAVGIERNRARHALAVALAGHLAPACPMIPRNARFLRDEFPAVGAGWSNARSIAVLTNLVGQMSSRRQHALMRALASFEAVLVDFDRFVVHRASSAEREDLWRQFMAAGFESAELAIDLGDKGRYYLLRPSVAMRKRAARFAAVARAKGSIKSAGKRIWRLVRRGGAWRQGRPKHR